MDLVKQTYTFGSQAFEAWFLYISGVVWISAIDVCRFLGYTNPHQALRVNITNPNHKKTYEEMTHSLSIDSYGVKFPENWRPGTIFINEAAFNKLILRSRKPEAEKICDWVCEDVLPMIRKTGEFKLEETLQTMNSEIKLLKEQNNSKDETIKHLTQALIRSNERLHGTLESVTNEMSKANDRIYELSKDAIVKPDDQSLLHGLAVMEIEPNKLVCLRRQIRTLGPTVKRLEKQGSKKIFHKEKVPNATNAWTVAKQKLRELDPKMKSKANQVTLDSIDALDVSEVLENVTAINCNAVAKLKL